MRPPCFRSTTTNSCLGSYCLAICLVSSLPTFSTCSWQKKPNGWPATLLLRIVLEQGYVFNLGGRAGTGRPKHHLYELHRILRLALAILWYTILGNADLVAFIVPQHSQRNLILLTLSQLHPIFLGTVEIFLRTCCCTCTRYFL